VRKLAEQSNSSVQEIEAIINELTIKTNKAVETMTIVGETINQQTASVNDTRGKFEGIAEAIEKTRQAIELLNSSSKKMDQKKNEIIEIIHNLSAIAEENAAGTEEGSLLNLSINFISIIRGDGGGHTKPSPCLLRKITASYDYTDVI
jgi:methyl-accepting chemotaxis protein